MHPVTVFVCTACRFPASDSGDTGTISPGEALLTQLLNRLPRETAVTLQPVDCLAVCDRPCTIAFSAPGKWTYVIGDIDPETDAEDVLRAAAQLAASDQPVLALADRPPFFRKGVIGRVPFLP